ncbi:pseudouridine synthase [Salsipaludibacter albus]|uniref:pseudouridine synthase n=1 Tax=Salsipaludibacter albus TaxID=2849650 RepID=UPI001EE43737|nr:pseudouridine synthase [Salsipaludibacter albus]MBY5162846.1 rRNA pseudouridine synthase [Salsipaludibacter albus]
MARDRLQKVMAHAGIASRRASEELIAAGRVTVNGEVATLGRKVDASADDIRLDGERVNVDQDLVHVMLNKPQGIITTVDDPRGRPTVVDLVAIQQRIYPVGRLDADTEGLLLLTNDGELTHKLLHPSHEVEKIYVALVRGTVRDRTLVTLRDGVELEDGFAKPRAVTVLESEHDQTLVQLTMTEGRKREVRRLLDAVGHPVKRLARVSFGGVELGELRQGKWRFLTQQEIARLHAAVEGRSGPDRSRRTAKRERQDRERAATRAERAEREH